MAALLVLLLMQLACQILCATNPNSEDSTCVQSTQTPEQPLDLPTGYVAYPDIGVAYKSHDTEVVTWNEARKLCMSNNATLAIIDSWRKHNHVMSVKPRDSNPHLGHHRLFDRGEWTSVKNGRPMAPPLPWAIGQPNQGLSNNCGAMFEDGKGLAAIPCYWRRHFICEVPISKDGHQILSNF